MWLLHSSRRMANIRRLFLSSFRLWFCANSEKTNGTQIYYKGKQQLQKSGRRKESWRWPDFLVHTTLPMMG